MDSGYRKLLIWTFVSSFLVIVGIGHGLVPIVITEFAIFIKADFRFSFNDDPEAVVMTSSLIFLVGQIIFLMYLKGKKSILFWLSFIIFWFGMFILIRGEGGIILVFGLPFVILSYIVFVKSIIKLRTVDEDQ